MSLLSNASGLGGQGYLDRLDGVRVAPGISPVVPQSGAEWFEYIAPDFVQGNISIIAGAKKLIEAKAALKRSKGSFGALVEELGLDQDKAERLMKIARHPVLSDSAHARNLPLSWMTLFTLSKIPAAALAQLIEDGSIHPGLERKAAERLVERARARNSTNGNAVEARDADHGGDHGGDHGVDHGGDHDLDHGDDDDDDRGNDDPDQIAATAQDDVGSDSRCEIDRKLARLEELEPRVVMLERVKFALESEVEELKAKLDEVAVRHQRRLFRQALDSIGQAETGNIPAKEKRALHNSAITDLTEFVRSAARDGLSLNQFDIFCRPEAH